MRRLARHLFTLCSALSLLLCVATAWGSARSRGRMDNLYRGRSANGSFIEVNSYDGAVTAMAFGPGQGGGRGFAALAVVVWEVRLPYWLLTSTVALPLASATAWHLFHRRKGRARGLCPLCGYDLRASPERCPECGAAAS